MGEVYRARQVGRLDRWVALKVIRPDRATDPHFRQRFEQEARIAAAIEHPNVIPIYEAGEDQGALFIAMRYVVGTDLRAVITQEGRLQPVRAVNLIAQVASALGAAHAAGLVHRDVKPANVLLSNVDGQEHAYLTDFGLGKYQAGSGLTQAGQFVGTVDYMAPEQFGDGPIDGRTDVYALGCVLFEELTGQPPFRRPNTAATMVAHAHDPPPRPTTFAPVPPQLDEVVAWALRKQPWERYESPGALAKAAASAVSPQPETIIEGERRTEGQRRGWGWIAALAAAIVLAVAGAATAIVLSSSGGDGEKGTEERRGPTARPSDGTFEVVVPSGWRHDTSEPGFKLIADDESTNFLASHEPANGATVEDIAEGFQRDIETELDATIDPGGAESATLGGEPARRYTYTLPETDETFEARGRQVVAVHNDQIYTLTFTAEPESFNDRVAEFEQIVNSWRWL